MYFYRINAALFNLKLTCQCTGTVVTLKPGVETKSLRRSEEIATTRFQDDDSYDHLLLQDSG